MNDSSAGTGATIKPLPPALSRWTVLLAMGVAVFGSNYAFDAIGPLAPILSRQLDFSDAQIGLLQASYSLPNIFVLLAAGLIIDRIGARRSITLFSALVLGGLVVTSLSPRIGLMATGRVLTGIGAETLAMATHVAIARWFLRGELSLAFGIRTSMCRLGSLGAQTSPVWAAAAYASWRWPLWIAVGFGAVCMGGALLFWILDSRGERRFELGTTPHDAGAASPAETAAAHPGQTPAPRAASANPFAFNRSFWLLAAICVAFYGCIFPFQTFGQKFLIDAREATPRAASLLVGMEPMFSLLFMPLFGHLVDRFGNRSAFMLAGSLLLVPVFFLLGWTGLPPVVPMAMMGVAFALVPAVLWMSVVLVVDRARLGFASAVVDACQQLGLFGVNLAVGWSNDHWLAGPANGAGYRPGLLIFTALAVACVACAFALRRVETGPRAHGLETIRTHGAR